MPLWFLLLIYIFWVVADVYLSKHPESISLEMHVLLDQGMSLVGMFHTASCRLVEYIFTLLSL
jgi:hypothetical protein